MPTPHILTTSHVVAILALMLTSTLPGDALAAGPGEPLRAAYASMRGGIEQSPFGKPLQLRSSQAAKSLKGDIHAVIAHPFQDVRDALREPEGWCDILILHPNVTQCRLSDGSGTQGGRTGSGASRSLTVHLGKAEHPVQFSFDVPAAGTDYLQVGLSAATGPMGTTDYRIQFEATPLDAQRTIVHLSYSHGFGTQARLAMQLYLGTLGRGKVGFTRVERSANAEPVYVGGVRGALERNAMRYYLAIEAYLDSLKLPQSQQPEQRLRSWMANIERYPLQLAEDNGYIERKRGDIRRQLQSS